MTVCKRSGVDPAQGLDRATVAERSLAEGPNSLEQTKGRSAFKTVLKQFSSVVIWLLVAAAIAAYFTDSPFEALAIAVVLLLNAFVGFAIEWQADRSLEALRKSTRITARVRRDGLVRSIESWQIVRGDIVILSAGDRVPADARLIEAASLSIDESTLTGESLAVEKSNEPVNRSAPLAERRSMVFLGTNVISGRAAAIVTAIGPQTELGQIGQMLQSAPDRKTPLERRLAELGRRLFYVVLVIAAVVLLFGLLRGEELWLMAEVSISLAVAAVPEGLPAVTTLILALGLLRMARRSAIVRNLASVETLGSTTVICTDKTGTLTENRLSVQEMFLSDGRRFRFPDDNIESDRLKDDEPLLRLLRVGLLCNEAVFHDVDGFSVADPTEAALINVAAEFGLSAASERRCYRVTSEIPFTPAEKKMTVVLEARDRSKIAMQKGAPSVVLNACRRFIDADGRAAPLSAHAKEAFLRNNEEMAGRALRVLAFADKSSKRDQIGDLSYGYTFLGFMAMADPPRAGALQAVREARNAGIRVVMLTGDQMSTAGAIARQLCLSKDHDIYALHSRDVADSDESKLAMLARRAHVFARVTPEDKLKIVRALQRDGEIVAVTGDGVNDAPALKQADIGVAFGERGTDVAKEAANVVLTNDNFATIVKAIEGGRTIYSNIIKFVHLMFSHNLGEILVIFGAIVAGLPLPLLPLQILWINLVTDVFPALALAVEPPTPDTMHRKPRPPGESLLSGKFMALIAWQGAMLAAIAVSAYVWALQQYGSGEHARTIALLALVGVQLGHLFNCRSRTRSTFDGFFGNPFIFAAVAIVVALQLLAVYFAPLSAILGLVPPSSTDWIVLGITFALPVVIVEFTKLVSRSRSPFDDQLRRSNEV